MHSAEVVVREVQRKCRFVVLPFFRKRICQSRHPTHGHANVEVIALNVACANSALIRAAVDDLFLCGHYLGRRVASGRAGVWSTIIGSAPFVGSVYLGQQPVVRLVS